METPPPMGSMSECCWRTISGSRLVLRECGYQVNPLYYDTDGRWNMGGKLPGLRGGPDSRGCSGGNETDGTSCFSTRLMWRSGGAGEGTPAARTEGSVVAANIQYTRTYPHRRRISVPTRRSPATRTSEHHSREALSLSQRGSGRRSTSSSC